MRLNRRITTAVMLALIGASTVLPDATLASARGGLVARRVVTGLNGPAGFTFLPDGKIVYLERGTGEIRIYDPRRETDRRFFRVRGVNGQGERGALGVAVAPGWPSPRSLYVYVTRSSEGGGLRNQIVGITRAGGRATMRVLVSTPASSAPYHNGGRILFGPDGMLYAIVGDGHDPSSSQDLTGNLRGKILRMTPDGGVPSDNPIPRSRIFAFGIRNSFGFTFDPLTDRLWETENGPACNDELNLVVAGGNYGWGPNQSCQGPSPGNTNNSGPLPRRLPKLWFKTPIAVTGAAFCDGCGLGDGFEGDLFFGAANDGRLRRVSLDAARDDVVGGSVSVLQSPNSTIYSVETAPDGRIYFSDYQGIYRVAPA